MNRQTNQANWFFLPDFQREIPLQAASHKTRSVKTIIPKVVARNASSVMKELDQMTLNIFLHFEIYERISKFNK